MLRSQINEALKQAMRDKDQVALSTIRLIMAALKDRDIQARTDGHAEGLSDEEILQLLQTMVKQRKEAISLYEQGGRVELLEREQAEILVIQRFLPKQMDDAEVREAVKALIEETGASSIKDMGATMAELRSRYAGRMDFGKASVEVKKVLVGQ